VGEVLMSDPAARRAYALKAQRLVAQELREFQADAAQINQLLKRWLRVISARNKYLLNRMESLEPTLKSFFDRAQGLAEKAADSRTAAEQLKRDMGWYTKSGDAKALVKLTLQGCQDLHRSQSTFELELLATERTALGQVHDADEDFFTAYLNAGRPPMRVYRGDGRGTREELMQKCVRRAIDAEGSPDVSFFGVVQHIESSTNKNGMLSTTTNRAQALDWALDSNKHGLLYTFDVSRYIDTIDLLRQRNFKHRHPAQQEILVPTQIPAGECVSVQLFAASDKVNPIMTA
jgi:hypothetical protein